MNAPDQWRIYWVADAGLMVPGDLLQLADQLLTAGGIDALQLRAKRMNRSGRRLLASEFRRLCRRHDCPLMINDDVQLAQEVDAEGVHLGPSDQDLVSARLILGPDRWIGASARDLEGARAAEANGADHLGCGNLFGTLTKADAPPPMGLEPLRALCAASRLPVFGIGGVDASNAVSVLNAGARGVAVASALIGAPDPLRALADLRAAVDGGRGPT